MKILKIVVIAIVAVVALLMGIGLVLPRDWNVERSILIRAEPAAIHRYVETPSTWREWFAWDDLRDDPSFKVTISGPASGVGAAYEWTGNLSGSGRIVITYSDPKSGIRFDEAIQRNEVNAKGSILYTSADGGMTRVTWSDSGMLPAVIGGYFRGSVNEALGKAFETSLGNLKSKVEGTK